MKKLMCVLLAALMILSLVACGDVTNDPAHDNTQGSDTTAEQETADPNYICDLPADLDYGGETVGILYVDAFEKKTELISEKLGEGVVSDAVYERNTIVQEELGINYEFYGETRTVDVHIRHIRQKLGDDQYMIETVRGVGYKMKAVTA